MNREQRQAVLDVLNSLEVIEQQGGDDAYILVENSLENRTKLNAVGVKDKEIYDAGGDEDSDTFCILALAFNGRYADGFENGKPIVWGPIDDALRYRVLEWQGTPTDAYRLLMELHPELDPRAN